MVFIGVVTVVSGVDGVLTIGVGSGVGVGVGASAGAGVETGALVSTVISPRAKTGETGSMEKERIRASDKNLKELLAIFIFIFKIG